MSYVLLISLGPIQDFITSARRCQDLWFGSWFLSELALAAAKAIDAHPSGGRDALVFPGGLTSRALEGKSGAEVANKIVAVIAGDADAVRAVADAARKGMERRRDELVRGAFERAGAGDPRRSEHFHEETARAQVRESIELLWVAARMKEGVDGYRDARHEAERLLAARKNTRRWSQPSWGASVPKSSLDGQRESVLDESLYPRPGQRASVDDARRRRLYGVEGAERLCGVSLLKRLGRRPNEGAEPGVRRRFFSTSHLAALPWMLGLDAETAERDEPTRAWTAYCAALDDISSEVLAAADVAPHSDAWLFGHVDGALLYDGRLVEALDECGFDRERDQRAALDALHAFRKRVGRAEPQGYYAILHADGDRMGRVIDNNDHAAHVQLSKALVEFARDVYGVVRAHQGTLVYSGGDDVLALLPLHGAVACAAELATRFATGLAGFVDAEGHAPTLSAGLAVVHHLTPFDAALDVARRAEKLAKKTRDALAIIVDKRGGAEVAVTGPWTTFVPGLARLVSLHRLEVVSDKAGHALAELERLTRGTRDASDADRAVFTAMTRSEATRILSRSHEGGGGRALDEKVRAALDAMIPAGEPNAAGWLGDMLVVASGLARVADEAGLPKPATVDEVLQ